MGVPGSLGEVSGGCGSVGVYRGQVKRSLCSLGFLVVLMKEPELTGK